MSNVSPKTPAPKPLGWRGRFLLIAFGLGLVLLLLAALEVVLRSIGYQKPDPFFETGPTVDSKGTLVYSADEWVGRFFFQKVDGRMLPPGSSIRQFFFTPKPERALRVAIVGESTVQGFPHPENLSISKYLEQMLQDMAPDREVQVFNFGFTAVASYPVARVVEEIIPITECDAVIILVGHNEFFGAYGVASSQYAGGTRTALALHERYNDLRFTKLLRAGIEKAATLTAEEQQAADEGLIRYMAAESAIGPSDRRRRHAANLLHANVTHAIQICQEADIPVLVSTMPSNISGMAPVGRSSEARPSTDGELAEAMKLENPARAEALEKIAAEDPNHALLWFRLGEAREALEKFDGAREAYERALELDGMPWRATAESNEALRRAARENDVPLIDAVERFQQETRKAAPGWDLFDDHVHPSITGRALYARAFAEALAPVLGLEEGLSCIEPDAAYHRILGGDNLLSIRFAFGRARGIYRSPPMSINNEQVHARFTELIDSMDAQMSEEEAAAWRVYQELVNQGLPYPPLGLMAGTMMMQNQKYGPAIYQLGIARQTRPPFSMPFIQAAWTEGHCRRIAGVPLGAALERDLQLSLMALDILPQIDEGPEYPLHKARGQIHWVLEEFEPAIASLEKALQAATTDAEREETETSIKAIREQMEVVARMKDEG